MVTLQSKPTNLAAKSVDFRQENFSNCFWNSLISVFRPNEGRWHNHNILLSRRGEVMQKKFPGKRKAIALGVILASFSVPVAAQDDIEIEDHNSQ